MARPIAKYLSGLVVVLVTATPFVACRATAQEFRSVSNAAPAAAAAPVAASPAATAPAAAMPAGTAPAAAQPSGSPGPAAPAAQLAAVGFSSVSSIPTAASAPPAGIGVGTRAGQGPDTGFEYADRVLVDKGDRRLYLYRQGRVIAEYPIKLGLNPYGHKQREGDFRTPEGKYTLTRRNARSEFFLAIQVSYPSREDAAWAKENGREPGGLIMIHGQPNVPKRPADFYANRDWTDGCIALSNSDMVDVWLRTSIGLPIEIRP